MLYNYNEFLIRSLVIPLPMCRLGYDFGLDSVLLNASCEVTYSAGNNLRAHTV